MMMMMMVIMMIMLMMMMTHHKEDEVSQTEKVLGEAGAAVPHPGADLRL